MYEFHWNIKYKCSIFFFEKLREDHHNLKISKEAKKVIFKRDSENNYEFLTTYIKIDAIAKQPE